MSVAEASDNAVVPSIGRRAVDLARDGRTPSDEGADHLVRLAMGRRDVLAAALADLGGPEASWDVACAQLLLSRAIELTDGSR